jgi:hypothetical protein
MCFKQSGIQVPFSCWSGNRQFIGLGPPHHPFFDSSCIKFHFLLTLIIGIHVRAPGFLLAPSLFILVDKRFRFSSVLAVFILPADWQASQKESEGGVPCVDGRMSCANRRPFIFYNYLYIYDSAYGGSKFEGYKTRPHRSTLPSLCQGLVSIALDRRLTGAFEFPVRLSALDAELF